MKWFAVFNETTGVIARSGQCADEDVLKQAALLGEVAIEVVGPVDPSSKRIDIETGQPVDYTPPQPQDTERETWELVGNRWRPVRTFAGKRADLIASMVARIRNAEAGTDRALRQMVLADAEHPAYIRMQAIEDSVAPLREAINDAMAAEQEHELTAILARFD